jgi:hypothetical protein
MKFNICFGNSFDPAFSAHTHFVRISLGSGVTKFLRRALEELGHTVYVSMSYVDPDAINLFFERFHAPEQAVELRKRGYRFGIICSEPLDEDGLYNSFEYGAEIGKRLYDSFAISAQNAEFVWHWLESAGPGCSKLNPNSHFLPFGHVTGFEEAGDPATRTYQADFALSGQRTERRVAKAEELRARGLTVAFTEFEPDFVQISMLQRARATLHVQKSDTHQVFSLSRVHQAVMNRVPIIMEYEGPPSYLAEYCVVASPHKFIDACAEFAKRTDIAAYAQSTYDRFAQEMLMRPLMTAVIQKTFAR